MVGFVSVAFLLAMVFYVGAKLGKDAREKEERGKERKQDASPRSAAVETYYQQHPEKDPRRVQKAAEVPNVASPQRKQKPSQQMRVLQESLDAVPAKTEQIHDLSSLEDRKNDWLARQIRAEKSYNPIADDMNDLKREHMQNCDAEHVKYRNT